jgi:H+/Cl- antiporter ClcA
MVAHNKNQGKRLALRVKAAQRRYPASLYIVRWLLISLGIGLSVGSASAGFLYSLEWATRWREDHLWIIALLPLGGLLIGLLYHYAGREAERGNNLLIDTVHDPGRSIPFRMAPLVYVGTIATHFFGGSAGREGTALQMAGAIVHPFARLLRLAPGERTVLITAAVAAGFGSVFGTPLAGAIFALEVFRIGRLRYNALFPAFSAAILADLVAGLWQAPHTHYHIDVVPATSFAAVGYAIAAGAAFGLCAALFSKAMHRATAWVRRTIAYPPLRPFIGGIAVAAAVWAIGTTRYIGLGIPTILASFQAPLPAYVFAIKMAFTIATLSTGFKGGEVTPLFFIGAALGSALSAVLPLPTALLAGMGFAAVFAGATNAPIASSIMAIELFGSACGVYVGIACVTAYMLSGHTGIYTRQEIGEPKHPRFATHRGKRIQELGP